MATHSHRTVMVIGPPLEQAKLIFNELLGYSLKKPLNFPVDRTSPPQPAHRERPEMWHEDE